MMIFLFFLEPSPSVNYLPSVKIDVDVTPAGSNKINITWSVSKQELYAIYVYLTIIARKCT